MKRRYIKSLNEIWHERKRTVGSMLVLFAVVMVAIMGVRALLNYVDFDNLKNMFKPAEEEHGYSTMYNASRYFFRIYYPEDKWKVEGEAHGFLMDEGTGLVAEMYPLIYADPVTPAPGSDPEATAAVVFDKIRDDSLTVRFYYRNYTDEMLAEFSEEKTESTPGTGSSSSGSSSGASYSGSGSSSAGSASPADADSTEGRSSPAPATAVPVNTDIALLDAAAEKVYTDYKDSLGTFYEVSELKTYKTTRFGYTLRWFTYTFSYPGGGGPGRTTDVYIIARSSNYLVITYESIDDKTFLKTPESYAKYREEFLSILNEFQLSVFSD